MTRIAHETHNALSLYLMITPQGMRGHSGDNKRDIAVEGHGRRA